MDPPRIELGTVQCECTGMPFTYRPMVGVLGIEPSLHPPEGCVLPSYSTPSFLLFPPLKRGIDFSGPSAGKLHGSPKAKFTEEMSLLPAGEQSVYRKILFRSALHHPIFIFCHFVSLYFQFFSFFFSLSGKFFQFCVR